MRYLVTGATGFIGAEVVRQLAEAGHQVVALVRDPVHAKATAMRPIEEGLRESLSWYRELATEGAPGA